MALDENALTELEEAAYKAENTQGFNYPQLSQSVATLVSEVRRLNHELADPRFIYGGSRAPRQAITCRNIEISALRAELKK